MSWFDFLVWIPWFDSLVLIPWFGILCLYSRVCLPTFGFLGSHFWVVVLGLDSWVWIVCFGFLGLDSWVRILCFGFLNFDSSVWNPRFGL